MRQSRRCNIEPLERKVASSISAHSLLTPSQSVIVALSGGADSVALLVALHSLGYKCVAAHCNFHLRGSESMRDEDHARSIASDLGCRFEKTDFDVEAYRAAAGDSISLEMACRELRYRWFDSLRAESGIERIAVAHNANDNAETLILNLLRGTSLAGARGMRHLNDRNIIRPMLEVSREEIEAYLRTKGIGYVTDSSNHTDDFTRNRIRHHVLPALQLAAGESKDALAAITTSLQLLSENHSFYTRTVEEKRHIYVSSDGAINLKKLTDNEPHASLLLYEWLCGYGFNRITVNDMLVSALESGRRFESSTGVKMVTSRGMLIPVNQQDDIPELETLFKIEKITPAEFHPERDAGTAYFDADELESAGGQLQVRVWRKGDRIKPFGMKGSRLLSDIFSDAKLTPSQKQSQPLLILRSVSDNNAECEPDTILWIPGLRASRHFPVTSATRNILRLKYLKQP